ncbi:non-histone chromosomal protein 6 [Streptomyces sp. NPDC057249]|uniref:non-histone chromosomal protein 6 n=1 Tax=Streptomyces sp. NPDC057249 TaxID=3346067 RepID=UPI00362C05FC
MRTRRGKAEDGDRAHRSRRKKDTNAPKRPLSAYMLYSQANRVRAKKENPDASFGLIGKILGKEWSELPEQAKAQYLKKAEDDKRRYEAEKAHYDVGENDE